MSRDDFEREVEALGEHQDVARRLLALELGAQSRVRARLRARLISPKPDRSYAGRILTLGAAAAAVGVVLLRAPRRVERLQPAPATATAPLASPLFRSVRPVENPSPFRMISAGRLIETRPIRIEQLFVRPAFARPSSKIKEES